jgi:hypothetical protein
MWRRRVVAEEPSLVVMLDAILPHNVRDPASTSALRC